MDVRTGYWLGLLGVTKAREYARGYAANNGWKHVWHIDGPPQNSATLFGGLVTTS